MPGWSSTNSIALRQPKLNGALSVLSAIGFRCICTFMFFHKFYNAEHYFFCVFLFVSLSDIALQKAGLLYKEKCTLRGAISFLYEFIPIEKEGKLENGSVASHDIVLIYQFALRMAKILWSFGCSECNRVNARAVILVQDIITETIYTSTFNSIKIFQMVHEILE